MHGTRSDVGSDVDEQVASTRVHTGRHPQHELHDSTSGQIASGVDQIDDAHAVLQVLVGLLLLLLL